MSLKQYAEDAEQLVHALRNGGITVTDVVKKHGIDYLRAKKLFARLPFSVQETTREGERVFVAVSDSPDRGAIFMSADDIPDEFLDDLNDGLYEDEIDDALGEYGFDVDDPVDAVEDMRELGYEVSVDVENGRHRYELEHGPLDPEYVETRRNSSQTKQTITRKITRFLEKEESRIKSYRKAMGPVDADTEPTQSEDGYDVIIHRSDDHFGDIVKNDHGDVLYDSETAELYVRKAFDDVMESVQAKRDAGHDVDNAHVLLGGDHVTNEAIYDSQPHDIDETIRDQIDRTVGVYTDQLERLSEEFNYIQVVCQGGNHGEFRVKGSSKDANADDIMYDQLANIIDFSDIDNVNFVKSDRSDYVNFKVRDWKGHLRHGDNVNNHIGTSAPQSTWGAFLNEHDFDIAFRGHYHEFQRENISGTPVIMAPSQKPADEFAGTLGEFSDDELIGYIMYASDESPAEFTEEIRL